MKNEHDIGGQFLVAERRGRQVALPLAAVRGGLPKTGLEPVPRGELDWLGVLTVRGEIVVAMAVDAWLDLDGLEEGAEPAALVLFRAQDTTVALAFDRLREVVTLEGNKFRPHPAIGQRPWLTRVYSNDDYARLDVIDGPAFSAAIIRGGRGAEVAS